VLEPVFDTGSEVLQACDDQEQFASLRGLIRLRLQLLIEAPQALFRTANPKRKLFFVEKTFGVTVDQTGNRLLKLDDLRFYRMQVRVNFGHGQAPSVLVLESRWTLQESAHLSPNGRLEKVTSDLRICAYPSPAESIAVSAGAAVVNIIDELSASTSLSRPFGVICISARTAAREALEKTARMPPAFARPCAILSKLLLGSIEQRLIDKRRDRNRNPIVLVYRGGGMVVAWMDGTAAEWAQALPTIDRARFPISCLAFICGILKNMPNDSP
jgi:hypothetical protein